MDTELKKELMRVVKPYRPRPPIYAGKKDGRQVVMANRSLTYNQLAEKYHCHTKTPLERTLYRLTYASYKNSPWFSDVIDSILSFLVGPYGR